MAEPSSKRTRTAPCPCPICCGCLRDQRTIERHVSRLFTTPTPCNFSAVSDSGTNEIDSHVCENEGSLFAQSDCTCTNSPTTMLSVPVPKDRLVAYVLQETKLKLERGHSVSDIEQHLRNAATLVGGNQIPSTWPEVLKLMKTLGYSEPRHYKVCVSTTHSVLLQRHRDCPICRKQWQNCIDYYCLGLHFCDWFATEEQCNQLMDHWHEKEDWLSKPSDFETIQSELWHGQRFREMSWFWDPAIEYLLPERCPHCRKIVPATELKERNSDSIVVQMNCPHCSSELYYTPQMARGDPRNQAIIIHEDGWNPNSTSARHSIAAITITHACMKKANRSSGSNARVYSFIPVNQLPRDAPHKYDAFFEPLVEEIENLFINGEEVFFKAEVEGFSPLNDFPTLRLLPLLVTADSKAHAEIGLTTAGGYKGCRRCNVSGTYIAERRHYYYGNFRYRFQNPAEERSLELNRRNGRRADKASSVAERKRITRDSGVTGECIFYRFTDLCGFDPIRDLAIDAMHAVVLNLVKTELENHLLADLGPNASVSIAERDSSQGGLLDRNDLVKSLSKVKWTTELKDGRVPSLTPTHDSKSKCMLGHWKSEEFSKFILVAPVILRELVPQKAYESICLLAKVYHLIFSERMRIQGWTREDREYLRLLLWRHAIMYEELYGLSACTENVEYSLHMPDDIVRHSTLDNYWCYMYERQVRYYKRQTTNNKSLCKTYADRAQQLYFVNTYLQANSSICDASKYNIDHISEPPILLCAKTASDAVELKEYLLTIEELPEDARTCYELGIVVGAGKIISLNDRQMADIKFWLEKDHLTDSDEELPQVAQTFRRIFKPNDYDLGVMYRVGEFVVLQDSLSERREWVMEISSIIVYGPIANKYKTFVDGNYFAAKTFPNSGELDIDKWSGQPKMVHREFRRLCVQPTKFIERKIMLYPVNNSRGSLSHYLIIDPD